MLITRVMRNARAHKLQWGGPTVNSSTVAERLGIVKITTNTTITSPITTLNMNFKICLVALENINVVQIRKNTSSLFPVLFGVPQGSILGPLLFILFVNDLPLHSNQNLDLYADDSTLHSSSNSINELNATLCSAMKNIEQWSTSNGMV